MAESIKSVVVMLGAGKRVKTVKLPIKRVEQNGAFELMARSATTKAQNVP